MPSIKKGRYLHNKTGNHYEVIGVAFHSEDEVPMVVYRPLYESSFEYFVRPYDSFVATVDFDGVAKPRFEKIAN